MKKSSFSFLLILLAGLIALPSFAMDTALNFSGRLEQGAGAVSGPVVLTIGVGHVVVEVVEVADVKKACLLTVFRAFRATIFFKFMPAGTSI